MSEEKQIEEMASVLENAKMDALATIGSMNHGFGRWYAQALYNAGCRKQSEGKWIPHRFDKNGRPISWYCSNCRGIGDHSSYCSHCGAKMKGGE